MSKIPSAVLRNAISDLLTESKENKRKFIETVELQISLKNYDPKKDKRFAGTVKLPYPTKTVYKVCVLGDVHHCEIAEAAGIDSMNVESLKSLNKNKKLVKKLAKKYSAFLASPTVITQIPRLLGPGLNRAGKFPTPLDSDDLVGKIEDLRSTVKFQLKKAICLACAIGTVNLTEEQLIENVEKTVNFLVSLLKKNWQNVKTLYIKSSMGKAKRIY